MSRSVRRQILFVGVFLVVVALFVTLFRMGIVRGDSMSPTYESGQVVLVQRRAPFSPPLKHNDVVLVRHDRDVLIKRIYRLEGEELTIGFPYFPLTPGLEDFYEQPDTFLPGHPSRLFVPRGYLVVIGDNLRVSEDSRFFGPVRMRDVLGVVVNSPPPPYAAAVSLPEPNAPSKPPAPPR